MATFEREESSKGDKKDWTVMALHDIRAYWKTIITVATPIILMPLPLVIQNTYASCGYVVLIMAVYWFTECIPLPVTGFLPVILYPIFNVAPVEEVALAYMHDTNFVLLGGLIMAVALEEVNLHKRVALRILLWMGPEPRWLLFGMITTTGFTSMWMSNTSAAALMMPIALVVLDELVNFEMAFDEKDADVEKDLLKGQTTYAKFDGQDTPYRKKARREEWARRRASMYRHEVTKQDKGSQLPSPTATVEKEQKQSQSTRSQTINFDFDRLPPNLQGLCKAMLLCVAYGANIGGTATLNGTTSNLIFMGILEDHYGRSTPVNYLTWLGFGLPFALLAIPLAWAWLIIYFMGWNCGRDSLSSRYKDKRNVGSILKAHYDRMGPMTFAEWSVGFWFVLLIAAWIFRRPLFMPGWEQLFNLTSSSDASPAMLICFILFVFPKEVPEFAKFLKGETEELRESESILTWRVVQAKVPWGLLLLVGGGLAMAQGSKISGLNMWLGCIIKGPLGTSPAVAVSIVVVVVTLVTEMTSNAVVVGMFIPIVLIVASDLQRNPLYFALPATLASSFGFTLPISSLPNAIVYGTNMVRMWEMVVAGIVMNVICVCLTMIDITTWSSEIFSLHEDQPAWAAIIAKNATLYCENHS